MASTTTTNKGWSTEDDDTEVFSQADLSATAFADIEDDRATIDAAFIDPQTLVRFIEDLERMADRAGVALSIESASLPQSVDGYPSFRLTASGSFSGVYRFLALLETMKFFIAFDGVQLKKADKQPWSAAIQFQLLSFTAAP